MNFYGALIEKPLLHFVVLVRSEFLLVFLLSQSVLTVSFFAPPAGFATD
jgi:hypothetical protein